MFLLQSIHFIRCFYLSSSVEVIDVQCCSVQCCAVQCYPWITIGSESLNAFTYFCRSLIWSPYYSVRLWNVELVFWLFSWLFQNLLRCLIWIILNDLFIIPSCVSTLHTPFFRGSALAAATGGDPVLGRDAILALMEAVTTCLAAFSSCINCHLKAAL